MQYAMFLLIREVRRKDLLDLQDILLRRLEEEAETFSSSPAFGLTKRNGPPVHRILARLTDYVETRSGLPSHYTDYVRSGGPQGYEIEHIWADHFERYKDEFSDPSEFQEYRSRIGGLLLLPKSFNASYGDLDYTEKREYYLQQNLLARSLHEKAYEHNPGFTRFITESGLPFRPHPQFKKADLEARQQLYLKLAMEVWSPKRLEDLSCRG
jgi:hypothetical protein